MLAHVAFVTGFLMQFYSLLCMLKKSRPYNNHSCYIVQNILKYILHCFHVHIILKYFCTFLFPWYFQHQQIPFIVKVLCTFSCWETLLAWDIQKKHFCDCGKSHIGPDHYFFRLDWRLSIVANDTKSGKKSCWIMWHYKTWINHRCILMMKLSLWFEDPEYQTLFVKITYELHTPGVALFP